MTLEELAAEYRESVRKIEERIQQLERIKKNSKSSSEALSLQHRIDILKSMRRDAQSLAATCEHYYDRGYHRNERFKI